MAQIIDIDGKKAGERPPRGETPPKREPKAKPKAAAAEPTPKRRTPTDRKLAAELTSTYQGIGLAVSGIGVARSDTGLMGTGAAMVNNAEHASEAWLDLADQNPRVKAALVKFTEASAIGSLVAVHLSMAVPLLASRGVIPDQFVAAMSGATGGAPEAS